MKRVESEDGTTFTLSGAERVECKEESGSYFCKIEGSEGNNESVEVGQVLLGEGTKNLKDTGDKIKADMKEGSKVSVDEQVGIMVSKR